GGTRAARTLPVGSRYSTKSSRAMFPPQGDVTLVVIYSVYRSYIRSRNAQVSGSPILCHILARNSNNYESNWARSLAPNGLGWPAVPANAEVVELTRTLLVSLELRASRASHAARYLDRRGEQPTRAPSQYASLHTLPAGRLRRAFEQAARRPARSG